MSPVSSNQSESPDGSSHETTRRETLTSRAHRIIGRALDGPRELPVGNGKRGPPKKSPTRRREQVLAAQRTHRQRTQGYIKELEKEVLRLRAVEDSLRQENQTKDKTIRILQQTLKAHYIPIPQEASNIPAAAQESSRLSSPSARDSSASPAMNINFTPLPDVGAQYLAPVESTVGVLNYHSPSSTAIESDSAHSIAAYAPTSTGPDSTPDVTIDLTVFATIGPEKGCGQTAVETPSPVFESPATCFGQYNSRDMDMLAPTLNSQEAIDFILELERPCFPHIKYQYEHEKPPTYGQVAYNVGPAHVFMATTALVQNHDNFCQATSAPFVLPQATIGQLFATSLAIDFATDATPVQIWANIVRICAARNGVNKLLLRALTDEFNKYVRCNSFGSVVEKETVSLVLGYFFPGEDFVSSWN